MMKKHKRDKHTMMMAFMIVIVCVCLFGGLLYLMGSVPLNEETTAVEKSIGESRAVPTNKTIIVYSEVVSIDGQGKVYHSEEEIRSSYGTNVFPRPSSRGE